VTEAVRLVEMIPRADPKLRPAWTSGQSSSVFSTLLNLFSK
jgi:hypothetical protein